MIEPGDILVYPWKNGHPGHTALIVGCSEWVEANDTEATIRAKQWLNTGKYKLGRGGYKKTRIGPLDENGWCDCTGFISFCHKYDRYDAGLDLWWNTTAIFKDATGKQKKWKLITPDYDLARLDIIHCHSTRNNLTKPAITKGTGLLWKKKNGIVARRLNS